MQKLLRQWQAVGVTSDDRLLAPWSFHLAQTYEYVPAVGSPTVCAVCNVLWCKAWAEKSALENRGGEREKDCFAKEAPAYVYPA